MRGRILCNMRHAFFALTMLCLLAGFGAQAVWADGDAGLPGAFLAYGAGARALAMGRAFAGIADDATALYWNPGGLPNLRQNQAVLQYSSLIDGSSYQYLGYAHLLPYIGTLGVGAVLLNQGDAEGRDTYNEITNSFSNRQMAILLGFGADLTSQLSAGASFKIVNQAMMGLSGTGFGLDLGFMYKPVPFMNLGLDFQNLLAPSITLKSTAETYPMNMVFGLGFLFFDEKLLVDVDASKNMNQSAIKPRMGLEFKPLSTLPDLAVRGGIDDTEIGFGLGYGYMGFDLDYAIGFQTVETMHKVSLSYSFGGFILEVHAEPNSFSPVGINKVAVLKIKSQTKFQIRIWTLEIVNEAGAVVKKYTGEGEPPDHIVWDGLEDNMTPMPDGDYKLLLSVDDASGATRRGPEAHVRIQSILPLGISPVEVE